MSDTHPSTPPGRDAFRLSRTDRRYALWSRTARSTGASFRQRHRHRLPRMRQNRRSPDPAKFGHPLPKPSSHQTLSILYGGVSVYGQFFMLNFVTFGIRRTLRSPRRSTHDCEVPAPSDLGRRLPVSCQATPGRSQSPPPAAPHVLTSTKTAVRSGSRSPMTRSKTRPSAGSRSTEGAPMP